MLSALLLLILFFLIDSIIAKEVSLNLEPHSIHVAQEAQFALNELRKLSDSGIYSTLDLSKVISAAQEDGIFHVNTILKIELSSPYYKSKNPTEIFNVIVMKHKEDGVKSIAIDDFPSMDEDAIEVFWIRKVETKKRKREEAFRRLEIEALLLGEEPSFTDEVKISLRRKIDARTVVDLLGDFDTPSLQSYRQADSLSIQQRIKDIAIVDEEKQLATMSLADLYSITVDDIAASDYQKYRAKQLVDLSMMQLQKRFVHKH